MAEPLAGERRALALTVSTRVSAGIADDVSGPVLCAGLTQLGLVVTGPQVVSDGAPVADALRAAVAEGFDLIVTTGGTGLTPTDLTPEMTDLVIERAVPGIPEALRSFGIAAGIPTAVLSRGRAGVAGQTLIVNLPGSPGGVRDALDVLAGVVGHALDQLQGSDHPRPEPG